MTRYLTHLTFIVAFLALSFKSEAKSTELRFLQLNIWMECSKAPNAVEALIGQLDYLDPDVATFCELFKNDSETVFNQVQKALSVRGKKYYFARVDGRAILSKYKIEEVKRINRWCFKAILTVGGRRVAVYPSHSEFRYYSCYYPRGYNDGIKSWDRLPAPITDVALIEKVSLESGRTESAKEFVADARTEIEKGALVFYAGDFNEPSHLDWTEKTKEMFDHRSCVVRWPLSYYLVEQQGFVDAYRKKWKNPASHPGFTFPSACPGLEAKDISWAPEADERDRIDMIYYYPDKGLKLKDVWVAGPTSSVSKGKIVNEDGKDKFLMHKEIGWPSDHKGVFAVFTIQ